MIRITTVILLSMYVVAANAADTDDVIALVEKHWDARNAMDYQAQFDLVSERGSLNANSNGTFFTENEKSTLEEFKKNLANIAKSSVEVQYPEAIALSDTVILARYYLEGQVEYIDGTRTADYRTRVTHIWVKEGKEWKARSWHFSPLHQGGVHRD